MTPDVSDAAERVAIGQQQVKGVVRSLGEGMSCSASSLAVMSSLQMDFTCRQSVLRDPAQPVVFVTAHSEFCDHVSAALRRGNRGANAGLWDSSPVAAHSSKKFFSAAGTMPCHSGQSR